MDDSRDATVKVWDLATRREVHTLEGHTGLVNGVAFSRDGTRIASAGADQTVKVWDAATGRERLTLRGHTGGVNGVAFSPDGSRIASASGDYSEGPGEVKVWDAATGRERLTLKGHTQRVAGVAFSPDGSRVASSSWDGTVKVWDAATGQEPLTLKGHTEGGLRCCVQPGWLAARLRRLGWDGEGVGRREQARSCSRSRGIPTESLAWRSAPTARGSPRPAIDVKLWDAATGQEMLTLKGHTDAVTSVAFSPGRQADRLRQLGQDGEGVGRGDRPAKCSPSRGIPTRSWAWRSARMARGSPPPAGMRR